MFNFLKRPTEDPEEPNQYADWPRFGLLPDEDASQSFFAQAPLTTPIRSMVGQTTGTYSPAIIIGLGETGEIVLHQWVKQLSEQDSARKQFRLLVLHSNDQNPDWSSDTILTRKINLFPSDSHLPGKKYLSPREGSQIAFNQFGPYQSIKNYIIRCIEELRSEIQIFIVGSLCDPIIGTLGNLLQLLGLIRNSDNALLRGIIALLTFDSPASTNKLIPGDIYAALRELSRFTFKGVHMMEPAIGENSSGILDAELLDHIFLIDDSIYREDESRPGHFEQTAGQILSETLFVLTHPQGKTIWNHLKNEQAAGAVRTVIHSPVIHSLGITTLYLPLLELESYITVRLARAALQGERPGSKEGLFSNLPDAAQSSTLAHSWMISGPYSHPFFKWLTSVRNTGDLRSIPPIDRECVPIFAKKLAECLNQYLNNPASRGTLGVARGAVQKLLKRVVDVGEMCAGNLPLGVNRKKAQELKLLLSDLASIVDEVQRQISVWLNLLKSNPSLDLFQPFELTGSSAPQLNPFESPNQTFPFSSGESDNPFESGEVPNLFGSESLSPDLLPRPAKSFSLSKGQKRGIAFESLPAFFDRQIAAAVQELAVASGSRFRRSVLKVDNQDGALESFYLDVARPELSDSRSESRYFDRIRSRLGWWATVNPQTGQVILFAACLAHDRPSEADRRFSVFRPNQASELVLAVLQLVESQVQGQAFNVGEEWFLRQVENHIDFLRQAHQAFLHCHTHQIAALRNEKIAVRRGYLLFGQTDEQLRERTKHLIFQDLTKENSNWLSWQEKTRLTAFEITTNLPLSSVAQVASAYPAYLQGNFTHLYQQERHAREFEKALREINWENRDILLSPQTCLILARKGLVRLFFRAIMAGLIDRVIFTEGYRSFNRWAVIAFCEKWPEVSLADADEKTSLRQALQAFALDLPCRTKDVRNPFSAFTQNQYLQDLLGEVEKRSKSEEFKLIRSKLRSEVLPRWQQMGQSDILARDFACLLQVELDSLWDSREILNELEQKR